MARIWKNDVNLRALNKMSSGTLLEHIGIEIEAVGDDYIKASMPVDHRTHQPMGLLHGGATAALSESMGSIAGVLILENPSQQAIVGIELNINHLKSVTSGRVHSITRPVRIGRRIQVWNTDIYDDNENHISTSRLTTMIVENKRKD